MKKALFLLLALALIFPLVACGGGGSDTSAPPSGQPTSGASGSSPSPVIPTIAPPTGNVPTVDNNPSIVVDEVRHSGRNNSWDVSPWKNNGNVGNSLWFQIYSCLMASEAYGTLVENMHYDMAESIAFSTDKMTATIKLRDYIHDSKGNPIKAEDVIFSYETAPTISPIYAKIRNYVSSLIAIDEYTLEMKINSSLPGTWETLLSYVPVISKNWYEGASDEEKANDPATTGAYRVTENVPNTKTVLEAIDDFWQKDELRSLYQIVNVKRIVYIAINESNMRSIALENGELDVTFIEPADVDRFLDDPNFIVKEVWMVNPNTLVFNCSENSPLHNNPALRKAIMHAVDWTQAAIPVSGTRFARGHDVAPMLCSDYDDAWNDEPYYDYDPELAKQYLAEAGYNENSGLTLSYITRSNPQQLSAATVIQSYLKAIGINMVFDGLDQGIYDAYTTDPTKWDLMWAANSMPNGFVAEAWIYYFGNRGSSGNASFIDDPTLQALLDDAVRIGDKASRDAFRAYTMDMVYSANISNEPVYYVARKGVDEINVSFMMNIALNAAVFSDEF